MTDFAEAMAETRAKSIKTYDSGRVALFFDRDQQFDLGQFDVPGEIVRVQSDEFADEGYAVAVTVEPPEA